MKFANNPVYSFALGHACVDWAQGAIPALLPYFVQNYGLSYQEAASLVFANVLLSSVLQPVFGYYSDKVSLPWLIPIGPVCCGLSITLIGFSSSYWTIFLAAMICGLGSALFHPEAALLVGRIAGARKGQALSTFAVGGNGGFAVGPLVAGFCAYTLGIRSLLIFGVENACAALLISRHMPQALETAAHAAKAAKGGGKKKNDWGSFARLSVVILARSLGFTLSNTFFQVIFVSVLAASPGQGTVVATTSSPSRHSKRSATPFSKRKAAAPRSFSEKSPIPAPRPKSRTVAAIHSGAFMTLSPPLLLLRGRPGRRDAPARPPRGAGGRRPSRRGAAKAGGRAASARA